MLRDFYVFRNPLRPILILTTSPSNPVVREPTSVAIPFDPSIEKGALMQKAKVSHAEKIKFTMARKELPCVRR
jgi:hypothetical protein